MWCIYSNDKTSKHKHPSKYSRPNYSVTRMHIHPRATSETLRLHFPKRIKIYVSCWFFFLLRLSRNIVDYILEPNSSSRRFTVLFNERFRTQHRINWNQHVICKHITSYHTISVRLFIHVCKHQRVKSQTCVTILGPEFPDDDEIPSSTRVRRHLSGTRNSPKIHTRPSTRRGPSGARQNENSPAFTAVQCAPEDRWLAEEERAK